MAGAGGAGPQPSGMPPQGQAPAQDPNVAGLVGDPGDEPEPTVDSDTDPGYAQAMQLLRAALYESGAARDVAKGLRASKDVAAGLADVTYNFISMVDERTDGAVPDELMATFAAEALAEVVEVGRAAGVTIGGTEVAKAMQTMILRYVGENGGDATQLTQSMSAINPGQVGEVLDTAEAEADEQGAQ